MTKLYLHSSNARNNIHYLVDGINGNWKFLHFSCTNNMYNVNNTNNKVYLTENGVDLIITLTNGYYIPSDFTTMLSTALNNAASGTINVSLNANTNKYTFTNNTYNFNFTFATNTSNTARKLLGFNESDGTLFSMTQTSDIPIDLNTHQNIFINIIQNNKRDVVGENYFKSSLIINGNGAFGETLRYINDDNFNQYIKVKDCKKLEIQIHDINYNNIDLNSDYTIILEKC